MKSYLKTTAGVVLSATMATASYGATVNVGELQGFTGPLESMIGAMSGGANLAVTEANASGKYLQGTINVIQGDSVCIDAAVAIAQAEKMVNDDNVMAIMGPNCSGNTGAVITNVLVPNGIVSISPSATSPALTTLEDGGWFFRTAPSDARQGPVLASIAMARGQTDMAVTHSNSDYGKGLADAFVTAYEAMGGTVTVMAGHDDDKADYSADVAALSAGGSATLAILGYADTGGRGIIAASEDTGAFSDYVFGDGMIISFIHSLGTIFFPLYLPSFRKRNPSLAQSYGLDRMQHDFITDPPSRSRYIEASSSPNGFQILEERYSAYRILVARSRTIPRILVTSLLYSYLVPGGSTCFNSRAISSNFVPK